MKRITPYILAASLAVLAQGVSAKPRPLTVAEGEKLILVVLKSEDHGAVELPGFGIDHYKDPDLPHFVVFNANWRGAVDEKGESIGGSTIDNIEINMRNADVWEAVVCQEIKNPAVRKFQAHLRTQMKLDQRSYRRFRVPGPLC